jgi:hypothetical protein
MAKPGLDVGQRRTAGDQPCDMGVPKIVEPKWSEPLGRHCGHKLPPYMGVEVAVVQRQASPAGEHEVVGRSAINSLLEQRGHGRGDRDGPSGSRCLGMPEVVIPHRVFRP